jgi:hypothetical protein
VESRLPGSERLTDELETARREMILDGLDEENLLRRTQARFDLYSRSQAEASVRMDMYQEYCNQVTPYVEPPEEEEELSEEEKEKRFMELHRKLVEEGAFK